jgi:hypothetical protein
MSSHFTLDFSNFAKGIARLKDITPEIAERAMAKAAMALMNDCIMQIPTVPLREGWLRGSGSIFVDNKFIAESGAGIPGMAAKAISEPIGPGQIVGVCAFNTPYAAHVHEGIDMHFTEPSSGPKYLESKLISNKQTYFQVIANSIKEDLDKK